MRSVVFLAILAAAGCATSAKFSGRKAARHGYVRASRTACAGPCEVTLTYSPKPPLSEPPARVVWNCPRLRSAHEAEPTERIWEASCLFPVGEWFPEVIVLSRAGAWLAVTSTATPIVVRGLE